MTEPEEEYGIWDYDREYNRDRTLDQEDHEREERRERLERFTWHVDTKRGRRHFGIERRPKTPEESQSDTAPVETDTEGEGDGVPGL